MQSGKSGWLTRYRGSHTDMHLDMFREQLKMVTDLSRGALDKDAYSLFMVVFNQLDAVGHHFPRHADPAYPAYDPKDSPRYAGVITEFHKRLDGAVGDILGHVKGDPLVIIMSDHGTGPRATRYFHVNAWFASLGLLKTRKRGNVYRANLSRLLNFVNENLPIRQELRHLFPRWLKDRTTTAMFNVGSIAWPETKAYRVRMLAPIEGIEINLKGRQPEGTVAPGAEYEALRDQILQKLADLKEPDTGERLVLRAFRREELYDGPYVERAPDIVFELKPGYEGGPALSPPTVGPIPSSYLKMRSGNHTMTGIFVARGPFVRRGVELPDIQLADVTPTILYYLGLPIPENMDGRVVTEIFEPEFVGGRAPERAPALATAGALGDDLDAEDQEAMRNQLRGLGYL
jgi:predicted AlkP superfamily phosphohydrolase/phosphomutase